MKYKFVLAALILAFVSNPAFADAAESAERPATSSYSEGTKVPEPMTFDMAAHLGAPKGEMEFNTLFRFEGASEAKQLYYAPEFEYVFADGMAAEIEFPVADGELESFKVALQSHIGKIESGKLKTGVQLLYEQERATADKQIGLLLINSIPFGNRYALTTLIGPATLLEESETKWGLHANGSIHYTNSHEIDVALEANYEKFEDEDSKLELVPQIHLEVEKDVKVQFGFGAARMNDRWASLSAFRAAIEFQ